MSKKTKTFSAQDFLDTFQSQTVKVAPGVEYDYFEVLKQNRASYHSKFLSGEVDRDGNKRMYFGLAYAYYRAKYDMIDLDFKNIALEAINHRGQLVSNMFRSVLQAYVSKANEFGDKPDKIINEVKESLLKDGVCYMKLVGDTAYVPDPFNIIEPPSREGLGTLIEKSTNLPLYLIEEKYGEIEDLPEGQDIKENQKRLDSLIANAKDQEENLKVYEYWVKDKVPYCQVFINEKRNDDYTLALEGDTDLGVMVAEFESPALDQHGKPTFPYSKGHNVRVAGRRGGFSIFELTKGITEYSNKYLNNASKADDLNMANIYTYRQGRKKKKIAPNFLNNFRNGSVISIEAQEDIKLLDKSNATINAVNFTGHLNSLGREIIGASEIDMMKSKSHVSATAIKGAQSASESAGNTTLENMSMLLSDFVERLWGPAIFRKLAKKGELLSFTSSLHDLKNLDKYLVENELYLEMYKIKDEFGFYGYYDETGNPVQLYTEQEVDEVIKKRLDSSEFKGTKRTTKITNAILKSMKYDVRFVIGAEREDRDVKIRNLMEVLQMSQNNPITTSKIQQQIAELMHIDPTLFELTDQEMQMVMQQNQPAQPKIKGQQNKAGQPLPV